MDGSRRVRFSIGALMIAVALCALMIVPFVFLDRARQQVQLARLEAVLQRERAAVERARAQAVAAALTVNAAKAKPGTPATPHGQRLWAALAVSHAVVEAGDAASLVVECALVNDGDRDVDPRQADSRLVVNGKELADRLPPGAALPPGGHVRLTHALGSAIAGPGEYRVSWRGANFQAPEVTIRVVPAGGK